MRSGIVHIEVHLPDIGWTKGVEFEINEYQVKGVKSCYLHYNELSSLLWHDHFALNFPEPGIM